MSRQRSRSDRAGFALAVAALTVAFFYLVRLRSVEPLGLDQGLFACFGRFIPEGWVPYRDIWDSKPPLVLYAYAAAFVVFGEGASALWRMETIWLAASMLLIFAIAARTWGRWQGLLAAVFLLAGLWAPGWEGYWARAQAEMFLALPMCGAAWAALAARDRSGVASASLALTAGALTGVAGLFKVPALGLLLAWPVPWFCAAPWRRAAGRSVIAFAGAGLPWALMLLWFGWRGARVEMLDAVFTYSRVYADVIAAAMPPGTVVTRGITRLFETIPLVATGAMLGAVLLGFRRAAETAWLVPWMLLSVAAVLVQRQLAGYHFLLTVPALALAAAYGVGALGRVAFGAERAGTLWRSAAWGGLVLCAVLALRTGTEWSRAFAPQAALLRGEISRQDFLSGFDRGAFSPATEEQLAEYLRGHTEPGQPILVWGLSPGIYALADRPPATRYPFHHLLLTGATLSRRYGDLEQRREQFLESFRRDPPVYVLIGTRDRNGFEPLDSWTQMLQFPGFVSIVRREYAEETRIGRFLVYRRLPRGFEPTR